MNSTQSTSAPRGYRPGTVSLESDATLPAFLPDDNRHWNGFALPIFDRATIAAHRDALAAMFPAGDNPDALVLAWNGDRPSVTDPQYEGEEAEYVEEVEIDGQTFLSIGGGSFVWSEVEA